MFGKNPVRKTWHDGAGRLAVQAIFPTIQGEGPHAGQPAVFIRLAGCNLRCHFCDTDFETNIENVLSVEAIASHRSFRAFEKIKLVVVTGGEPLRQNIIPLFKRLIEDGYHIQIETAGTLWVPGLEKLMHRVSIVCSPKTAKLNNEITLWCHDYKYIIIARELADAEDGLPLALTQRPRGEIPIMREDRRFAPQLARPPRDIPHQIWVQPCDEQNPMLNKRNQARCVELALRYGYRISIQTHKILEVE